MSEQAVLTDTEPLPSVGSFFSGEQLNGHETVVPSVDGIVTFIEEQTKDRESRLYSPLRVATLFDSEGNQLRLSRYPNEINRLVGISKSGPSQDPLESPNVIQDGQNTEDIHEEFLVLQQGETRTLNLVAYDNQSNYSITRQCADEEAAILLKRLEDALKFQTQQRARAKRRMSSAAIRHAGF